MNKRAEFTRRNVHCPERGHDIDLALAVMCVLQAPGECFSQYAIAEVTGLSHGGAFVIEKRALKKLRMRLSREFITP